MNPNSWYVCPVLLVPAALLWAGLRLLCEHLHLCARLSSRFNWRKRTVEKWLNRILGITSLSITAIILFVFSYLIGFDLLNWEPF